MTDHKKENTMEHFFEGAEKLLEIWFTSKDTEKEKSLRTIPKQQWVDLLDLAQCQIVSHLSNDQMDSYVLSESSMFVSDRRFILKTCGTTRLLDTLERLLQLAVDYCNLDGILNVFYSRKNFERPELQPVNHKSFDAEVGHLDKFLTDGAAYCLGRMNQNRWYLYTLNPPHGPLPSSDLTLEILMSGLDRQFAQIFTSQTSSTGRQATKLSGIDKLVSPGTQIDEKLFEPCGYSMNGIVPGTDHYVTIHITPEEQFSYASFETNLDRHCIFEQTSSVINAFKPAEFLMTLFANGVSVRGQHGQRAVWEKVFPGYRRVDLHFLTLPEDTTLVYAQYHKTT